MPDNICVETFFGDKERTDAAFAAAQDVVEMDIVIDRVTGVPMEPRAALGDYNLDTGPVHHICRVGRLGATKARNC